MSQQLRVLQHKNIPQKKSSVRVSPGPFGYVYGVYGGCNKKDGQNKPPTLGWVKWWLKSSWWLNQPIWKILIRQIGSSPQGSGWKQKYLSCHHLEMVFIKYKSKKTSQKKTDPPSENNDNSPVILRILGFWTAPKIHHPWRPRLAPPIIDRVDW